MPPTLRPRRDRNKSKETKPKLKVAKQVRSSRKRKQKDRPKDVVDGPNFHSIAKRFRLSDGVDGGPVNAYPMAKRGPVLIINNYAGDKDFQYRQGSGIDVGKLTACFEKLGFHPINCFNDLTCGEMKIVLTPSRIRDYYRDFDCFVTVILSHGNTSDDVPDGIMGADGNCVALDELLSPFKKYIPTLVGKPKIFIIQTCRGEEVSIGVREPKPSRVGRVRSVVASMSDEVPSEGLSSEPTVGSSGLLPPDADRLIAFATGPGYKAYRDTHGGSWYIDELTKVLWEEYKRKGRNHNCRHLVDIITEVQGRVSNKIKGKYEVQMPEFRSSLRGPIYL